MILKDQKNASGDNSRDFGTNKPVIAEVFRLDLRSWVHSGWAVWALMSYGCPLWFRISFSLIERCFDDIFAQSRFTIFLLFYSHSIHWNIDLNVSANSHN